MSSKVNLLRQLCLLFFILQIKTAFTGETISFTPEQTKKILFSQSGVSSQTRDGTPLQDMVTDMKKNTFANYPPIEVVEMKTNTYTSLDNRRLVAANTAGVGVNAIVHQPEAKLPPDQVNRFSLKGEEPRKAKSYSDAVFNRMRTGSFDGDSVKRSNVLGYSPEDVRVRKVVTNQNREDMKPLQNAGFIVSGQRREQPIYKPRIQPQQILPSLRENDFPSLGSSSRKPGGSNSAPRNTQPLSSLSSGGSVWGSSNVLSKTDSIQNINKVTDEISNNPSSSRRNSLSYSPSSSRRGSLSEGSASSAFNSGSFSTFQKPTMQQVPISKSGTNSWADVAKNAQTPQKASSTLFGKWQTSDTTANRNINDQGSPISSRRNPGISSPTASSSGSSSQSKRNNRNHNKG